MQTQDQQHLLKDKKVVIFGGSTGLGFATAHVAANEGAKITLVSNNLEKLNTAAAQLPGPTAIFKVDLSQEMQIANFFKNFGEIDHFIYTAGENLALFTMDNLDIEASKDFFNIRYWGALASVKYAAPNISKTGSITLTGGIAGLRPSTGWGIAASICGAMDAFTRAMAVELAPIRVNVVSPGLVRTSLWDKMSVEDKENLFNTVASKLPAKRIGEAADIAQTYLYLMKQQFGTGQSIIVDGGAVLV